MFLFVVNKKVAVRVFVSNHSYFVLLEFIVHTTANWNISCVPKVRLNLTTINNPMGMPFLPSYLNNAKKIKIGWQSQKKDIRKS